MGFATSRQGRQALLKEEKGGVNIRGIAEFLETMQEGELDSSGSFSLDWRRAFEKLGRYQSDAPGFWLIKLLQAAVASRARHFLVSQAARFTSVRFTLKHSCREVASALRSWDPPGDRALAHLQLALQALSFVADSTHELHFLVGANTHAIPIREGRLEQELPPEIQGPARLEVVRHWNRPPGLLWNRGPSRRYLEENLFLQEVGRFAPIQILVDGRLLNDPLPNKPPGLRLGVPVPALQSRPWPAIPYTLLERIILTDHPEHQRMALLNLSVRKPRQRFVGQELLRVGGNLAYWQDWALEGGDLGGGFLPERLASAEAPFGHFDSKIERNDGSLEIWPDYNLRLPAITARGYLSIDICPDPMGRLYLVKDGVALKPRPLGRRYKGCLALWSEPEVSTDLSQLQVLENEVYDATVATVKGHFSQAAANVLAHEQTRDSFFHRLLYAESHRLLEWARNFKASSSD